METHRSNLAVTPGGTLTPATSTNNATSATAPLRLVAVDRPPASAPKPRFDPYAPIQKVPLVAKDLASNSRGFSVRIADEHDPSGWRECGIVRQDYLLVPNADVRDLAYHIALRAGGEWTLGKEHFDGKRFALSLLCRSSATYEVKVGDAVGYGLHFTNSYDGSSRLSASLLVWRLACTNGMLAPTLFKRVLFRHDHSAIGWEAETEAALEMIRYAGVGLQRFVDAARLLTSMRVTAGQLRHLRSEVLDRLPVTLWGKTMDRLLLHEELSGWGLLNAVTNVTWHAEKATAADLQHNEYAVAGLLEHALGGRLN